jgi:alpha-beta hydrolase superfamily lysophospholipase
LSQWRNSRARFITLYFDVRHHPAQKTRRASQAHANKRTNESPDHFRFTSADGLSIACVKWGGQEDARGVVQIAHGLGEHIGRYAELAKTLVQANFVVYGSDHRGHGLTAKPLGNFGDFGPGGFDQLVEDMASLNGIAQNAHPEKPLILLGHSMGSFAAQQFVLDQSHAIDGLALSGSGTLDGLAHIAQTIPPGEDPMKLMNAGFEPTRTPFDWLTRDKAEVDHFIRDPLCFASLSANSMKSFLNASQRLADPRELRNVRGELPIYVFSGAEDPVGQRLAGVRELIERYRSVGVELIAHDFYPGGRHEMLHESNRRDVFKNLLRWISRVKTTK